MNLDGIHEEADLHFGEEQFQQLLLLQSDANVRNFASMMLP